MWPMRSCRSVSFSSASLRSGQRFQQAPACMLGQEARCYRWLRSGHDITAGSSASGGLEAPRCWARWGFYFQPLPRLLGVLDTVGRGAHFWLAAKQRPFAAPKHNPAAVVGAKIEQLEGATHSSRGPGGFLASQPPELMGTSKNTTKAVPDGH